VIACSIQKGMQVVCKNKEIRNIFLDVDLIEIIILKLRPVFRNKY
jgi:hypothetical protein